MSIWPDLIVYSREQEPRLVVEVTAPAEFSDERALRFRRNLMAHGGFPRAPFFMLVSPEKLYLWKDATDQADAPPHTIVPTADVLTPFLEKLGSEYAVSRLLELAVVSWLTVITSPSVEREDVARYHEWIVKSGLLDSIRGGRVELEPAA